jgi:hypothetical protein
MDEQPGEFKVLPEMMGVTAAASYLEMSKPNLRKFLDRRGVHPTVLSPRPLWDRRDLERVRSEYLADRVKVEADIRRRNSALGILTEGLEDGVPSVAVRIGPTQRGILTELFLESCPLVPRDFEIRQVASENESKQALLRLRDRGFVELGDGGFVLTDLGREAAGSLNV